MSIINYSKGTIVSCHLHRLTPVISIAGRAHGLGRSLVHPVHRYVNYVLWLLNRFTPKTRSIASWLHPIWGWTGWTGHCSKDGSSQDWMSSDSASYHLNILASHPLIHFRIRPVVQAKCCTPEDKNEYVCYEKGLLGKLGCMSMSPSHGRLHCNAPSCIAFTVERSISLWRSESS